MRWWLLGLWAACMALNLYLASVTPAFDGTVETAAQAANLSTFRVVLTLAGWGAFLAAVFMFFLRKRSSATKRDAT